MADTQFDLIVIGGGPGDTSARSAPRSWHEGRLRRARPPGRRLPQLGCIPTKALLKNAYLYQEVAKHGAEWGFEFDRLTHNWEKVIGRSRGVADTLNKGIGFLFKKNNIAHFPGHAKITRSAKGSQPCEVQVFDKPGGSRQHTLIAPKVLIATGAVPRELPFAPSTARTSSPPRKP